MESQSIRQPEICLVTAPDACQFIEGNFKCLGTVSVPLSSFSYLWEETPPEGNGAGNHTDDIACLLSESIGGGWATCLTLGFGSEDGSETDPQKSLKRGRVLGRRLDMPKVFITLCDPAFCVQNLLQVSSGMIGQDRVSSSMTRSRPHWPSADDVLSVLYDQVHTMVESLHQNFEDVCSKAAEDDETGSANKLRGSGSCVQAFGHRGCNALAWENMTLRQKFEEEQRKCKAEVKQLREACHLALGMSTEAGKQDSADGIDKLNEVLLSPEEQRERVSADQAEAERQIEDLNARLLKQRVQMKSAEHAAMAADTEKEESLKQFSMSHQELKWMQERQVDNEHHKAILLNEIETLNAEKAKASFRSSTTVDFVTVNDATILDTDILTIPKAESAED